MKCGHSPFKRAGLVCITVLLLACSSGPQVVEPEQAFAGTGSVPVYITNHGWHTGVALPAEFMQAHLPQLLERFPGADYLEFGWGDRDFYQAEQMTSGLALQAVLWPTETVVRVEGLLANLQSAFRGAGVVKLCAKPEELKSLAAFLSRSFERNPDEEILPEGLAGRRSQFYTGADRYHMTNTCNVWTAKALVALGLDISPTLKLTAGSVMSYLHEQGQAKTLSEYENGASGGEIPARELACSP